MDPEIVDMVWQVFAHSSHDQNIVPGSMPILYFGDFERFQASPRKIVTVGLNPSKAEFPVSDPYERFREAMHVYPDILTGAYHAEYLGALNTYFRHAPYRRWFNAYEPILNGLDASYYDGRPNTAIHTDICSPLATDPTWNGLSHTPAKAAMSTEGRALWLRLLHHLEPDFILISVARSHVHAITNELAVLDTGESWRTVVTFSEGRRTPYLVESMPIVFDSGKHCWIVYGKASQTPFGSVSNVDKFGIGQRISELDDINPGR